MSVQLNCSSPRELHAIEYPGNVLNVERMLATLGGLLPLSKTLGGEQKRLQLNFHPENPLNKSIYGENVPRSGLLLAVTVRRHKKDSRRPPIYEMRILGHSNRSFSFENLCDFQFLPLSKCKQKDSKELVSLVDKIFPKSPIDSEYFTRTGVDLMCVPQLFARSDTLHASIFRANNLQDSGQSSVLGVVQKTAADSSDSVHFNMIDTFPERANPQIIKRMQVKYVSDEQLEKVKKLFDECPIWTRIALMYESGISHDKLKCIIPSLAFYFATGPWRTCFVRYGYDPRKYFESRHYQTFDFRLRFRSGMADFVPNRKETLKKKHNSSQENNSFIQDIEYPYLEENKLPRSRQCIMRYCDIHIPKIQEMLEKIPLPLNGSLCNERTGWLPAGLDAQVRQIVSNSIKDFLRTLHRKGETNEELEEIESIDQSDSSDADMEDSLEAVLEDIQIECDKFQ